MKSRTEIVNVIKDKVMKMSNITAAWEGGSTATGYVDELSDLDLYLVCNNNDKEIVLKEMVTFLECEFCKEAMYRLPEPTPHGFAQVFFKPQEGPELFYIDFVVIGEDEPDKYIDKNRHGVADIWVEKYKLDFSVESELQLNKKITHVLRSTVEKDFVIIIEMKKQIKRGIFTEAFPVFNAFLTRYLALFLNIKYRPEKFDFGIRYIYRDYPEKEWHDIERALKVDSIEELKYSFEALLEKYALLKLELLEKYNI